MAMLFAMAPATAPHLTAAAGDPTDPPAAPAPADTSPPPLPGLEPGVDGPADSTAEQPAPTPLPLDPFAPLEAADRDTLLRLAWRTLVGHLTGNPIRTADLDQFALTPALLVPHGCFVTILKGGQTHGLQGEIDATRPLYQQVIVWTRRAATSDPRFEPLTDLDLADATLRIEIIGRREPISGPDGIAIGRHGVFLEKWGRRKLFLPGPLQEQKWTPARVLEELCREASLPSGAWAQGARLEVFTTQVIEGAEPPPPAPAEIQPTQAAPPAEQGPDGGGESGPDGAGEPEGGAGARPEQERLPSFVR